MKTKILADLQISIRAPLIFEALAFCIKHFSNIALHSFFKKNNFIRINALILAKNLRTR